MSLKVWNAASDPYDHEQLADNFLKLDQHDHSQGRGVPIGSAGIRPGSITSQHLAFVPFAAPTLVTTLPTSPYDAQEIYYQPAALATAGTLFHLRYNAASASTYKWENLGGGTLSKFDSFSPYTKASSSFGYVGTSQLVAPLAGTYLIDGSWRVTVGSTDANKFTVVALSVNATVVDTQLGTVTPAVGVSGVGQTSGFSQTAYDLPAGAVIRPLYAGPDGTTTVGVGFLRYSITPIRVG